MEARWWGERDLAPDETVRWRVGPSEIWITRLAHEWRCHHRTGDDESADALAVEAGAAVPSDDDLEVDRLALRRPGTRLRLLPATADRPVVAHPETRVRLPRDEEIVLYVSTPLWLRVETVSPAVPFVEFPLQRPSDTWFGPSSMEGELCYATRTAARLNPANIVARPHRVVSAVSVVNRTAGPFVLEKLKLPLMNMSLFATPTGHLWTEKLTLEHRDTAGHATLQLGRRPPADAGETESVAGPRARPQRNVLFRAFAGHGVEGEA